MENNLEEELIKLLEKYVKLWKEQGLTKEDISNIIRRITDNWSHESRYGAFLLNERIKQDDKNKDR